MTRQPELTHDIVLICVDPWGRNVPVPATLGYRREDPYAVTLTFHSHAGDVTWVLSRALVSQGLAGPSGEGDVKVYPSINERARAVTILDFHSPDGRLVAQADTHAVQNFLADTFTLVPVSTESQYLDLDALIADLLGSKPV